MTTSSLICQDSELSLNYKPDDGRVSKMNPTVNLTKGIVEQQKKPKIVGKIFCPRQMYIYACSLCDIRLHGISMYKVHMKNVHHVRDTSYVKRAKRAGSGRGPQKKTYTCTKCNKQLLGSCEYKKHLKRHDRKSLPEAIKCPVCESIVQKNNLKFHLRKSHQTSLGALRPFHCKKCTRLFLRFGNLITHERKDHKEQKQFAPEVSCVNSNQEKQHVCSKCGRLFSTLNWLQKHEFSATCQSNNSNAVQKRSKCQSSIPYVAEKRSKDGLFKCSYCDSRYTFKFNALRHERSAHGQQKKHIRKKREISHDLEPTKEYADCANQSNSETTRKHRTPGGVKLIYADDLFCSYCPKFFSHISSKELHEKIHTGNWPHKCKNCEMTFRLPRTCSDHEMKCGNFHGMIWCHFCDYCTKMRGNLELHYQKAHEIELNDYEAFLLKESHSSDTLQNDADEERSLVAVKEEPVERMCDDDYDDDEHLWSEFVVIDD